MNFHGCKGGNSAIAASDAGAAAAASAMMRCSQEMYGTTLVSAGAHTALCPAFQCAFWCSTEHQPTSRHRVQKPMRGKSHGGYAHISAAGSFASSSAGAAPAPACGGSADSSSASFAFSPLSVDRAGASTARRGSGAGSQSPITPWRFASGPKQALRCSGHSSAAQAREQKAAVPQAPQRSSVDAPQRTTVQGSIVGILSVAKRGGAGSCARAAAPGRCARRDASSARAPPPAASKSPRTPQKQATVRNTASQQQAKR